SPATRPFLEGSCPSGSNPGATSAPIVCPVQPSWPPKRHTPPPPTNPPPAPYSAGYLRQSVFLLSWLISVPAAGGSERSKVLEERLAVEFRQHRQQLVRQSVALLFRQRHSRVHDDRQRLRLRVGPQLFHHVEPAELRQLQIENHQVGLILLRQLHRCLPVRRPDHFEACLLQESPQDFHHQRLIIH